jgi:hypothetical protein
MATATIQEAAPEVASARRSKEVEHLDGCPADRVERYDQTRPSDRQAMTTTRCIDCGSQRVDPSGRFTRREEKNDA